MASGDKLFQPTLDFCGVPTDATSVVSIHYELIDYQVEYPELPGLHYGFETNEGQISIDFKACPPVLHAISGYHLDQLPCLVSGRWLIKPIPEPSGSVPSIGFAQFD